MLLSDTSDSDGVVGDDESLNSSFISNESCDETRTNDEVTHRKRRSTSPLKYNICEIIIINEIKKTKQQRIIKA